MCGRFTLTMDAGTFERAMKETYGLDIDPSTLTLPRYNIAPNQKVPALIHDGTAYRFGHLDWGMPMRKSGRPLVNARAETLDQKPMFKDAFARRRCLILADGYYEWKQAPTGKTPMRIIPKSGRLFAMAGVYETHEEDDGSRTHRCAIVTTEANPDISMIHHRMPLILPRTKEEAWVHPKNHGRPEILNALLETPKPGTFRHYPVDPIVNTPSNDSEACIREASHNTTHNLFTTR